MPHQPVQVYAVEVPPGDIAIPAHVEDLPANLRITMAALDPSAPAQLDLAPTGQTVPRATLKIVKITMEDSDDDEDDEDYDSDDIAALEARLKPALGDSEDDSEEEDSEDNSEEENGGPSDPAKSKQARKDAAVKALLASLKEDDDEMDTDLPIGVNGIKGNKGKARASDDDEDSDLEDDDEGELEEYVICTLDTTQHYQQPIDITINEGEQVFFKVIGTHSVFLTGNYVADVHSDSDSDDDEDDMDYYGEGAEDDSDLDLDVDIDELDDLDDPRITEVDSEEEAPKLVKASTKAEKKGKNKRPAEDSEEEPSTLDALISKSLKPAEAATNGEKLSKKQAKKLKNNQGVAVAGAEEKETNGTNGTPASAKSDKKVQFAKNLEQGPTGSPLPKADAKGAKKEDAAPSKSGLGVKMVQGIKIDDKKLGKGPAAKKGDKVGMRYIGKLENGKVFDSNKKGKPFQFGLGKGEVIAGWDIGVAGMTVGGERRLTIPAKLAYGSKGVPGIPPNSTLVFDVKLITIN